MLFRRRSGQRSSAADLANAGVSGAVEEAAPPAPVESEIGKLVARIQAGETVVVRGAPHNGIPRRYRLCKDECRLLVSYRSGPKRHWYVNNNEWNVAHLPANHHSRVETQARAMLAAIFAGIPVCKFECGRQINSGAGDGIVAN